MSKQVASNSRAPLTFLWPGALLLALTSWGCCPDPSLHEASTDPTVTLVTISDDREGGLDVSPPHPVISKGGNGGIQWFNATTESVTVILLNAATYVEIAPGAYSTVHRLAENVAVNQSIGYTVKRGPDYPPDPPSVEVGP